MIIAGEASGDVHGATLARALRAAAPGCRLSGMGGRCMREAGVELIEDVTAAAVVGSSEALGRVPRLWRALSAMRAALAREQPDALVLIDFPEFNFRLGTRAHRLGVPVVYFIPPQVWAWRAHRIAAIRRFASLVLAIFPFEEPLYRAAGVPVAFVGHPIVDALDGAPSRAVARAALGVADDVRVVGLLPGSRREEVARMLPLMREAARTMAKANAGTRFVVGLAPTVEASQVRQALGGDPSITVRDDGSHTVIRAADVVLVASGTATLEAALLGTPMVVCYRVSRATEAMVRLLVRVPWISLANIVLGRGVVPELYQGNATGERLAAEALRLLGDPDAAGAQREAFAELAHALGEPGVGDRAARLILDLRDLAGGHVAAGSARPLEGRAGFPA
jgi:lipid-A-disaccharide synthase